MEGQSAKERKNAERKNVWEATVDLKMFKRRFLKMTDSHPHEKVPNS
jgi:hypothetical protein